MRRWNGIVSALILVLFLIHGIAGGFQMMGIIAGGQQWLEVLAWLMAGLIGIHLVLGVILTVDTLKTCKRAGASYFKENGLFWLRRISGLAIMLLILWHIAVFWVTGTPFRLHDFGPAELTGSLLLVIALVLHVLTNIRPLVISLGIRLTGAVWKDALVVLAVVLLFCTLAFLYYYFRWNTVWQWDTLWRWNAMWQ